MQEQHFLYTQSKNTKRVQHRKRQFRFGNNTKHASYCETKRRCICWHTAGLFSCHQHSSRISEIKYLHQTVNFGLYKMVYCNKSMFWPVLQFFSPLLLLLNNKHHLSSPVRLGVTEWNGYELLQFLGRSFAVWLKIGKWMANGVWAGVFLHQKSQN